MAKNINVNKRLRGKTWYVDYRKDGQRKVQSLQTGNETEAEAKRAALEAELNGGAPALSFADYARHTFLPIRATQSPASQKQVAQLYERVFLPYFGDTPLASVKKMDIERWLADRIATPVIGKGGVPRPRAFASLKVELAHLKRLFSHALENQMVAFNPVTGIVPPRSANKPDDEHKKLTKEEITKLLRTAAPKYRPIWKLAVNTGMRRQELLNLRIEHIDFDAKELTVVSTNERSTKSGKSRMIPLNDDALRAIESLRVKGAFRFMDTVGLPATRVVRRESGYLLKQVTPQTLTATFGRDAKRAGINNGITLHALRHTFISAYVNAPGNLLQDAMEIAGHSDISTTMGYVHTAPDNKHKGVANLSF